MNIEDVRNRAKKFRIADKNLLKELYLKSKSEYPISIATTRVYALVCEKLLYDVLFYTESGLPMRTSIIESFINQGTNIIVYPNKQFLELYGVLVEEQLEQERKLAEIEEEEALSASKGLI